MRQPISLRAWKSRAGLFVGRWRRRNQVWISTAGPNGWGFAVVGESSIVHEWESVLLADQKIEQRSGTCRASPANLRRLAGNHGVVVLPQWNVPSALREDLLVVPRWIGTLAKVPATLEELVKPWSKLLQRDLDRLAKAKFRHEWVEDPAWEEEFVTRYLRPSMSQRHGEFALSNEHARSLWFAPGRQATWIKVFDGSTCIAARLTSRRGDVLVVEVSGCLDGDYTHVRKGSSSALYLASIERAIATGVKWIDHGGVAPDLSGGLLVFKGKWGCRLDATRRWVEPRFFLFDPRHPGFRTLLERVALIAECPSGGLMVLSAKTPEQVPEGRRQWLTLDAWFCLREEPTPESPPGNAWLPRSLQPWFDRMELPRS